MIDAFGFVWTKFVAMQRVWLYVSFCLTDIIVDSIKYLHIIVRKFINANDIYVDDLNSCMK